ncbi:hypothetical protein OKW39_001944 [Paraburkholderia sp. MM6662-R1]
MQGCNRRLWGSGKVRCRGLAKNATRAFTALASGRGSETAQFGNMDELGRAAHEGGVFVRGTKPVEGFDRGRSALASLQFAEPEQGEPVRVWLIGHQLARAPAFALGSGCRQDSDVDVR